MSMLLTIYMGGLLLNAFLVLVIFCFVFLHDMHKGMIPYG